MVQLSLQCALPEERDLPFPNYISESNLNITIQTKKNGKNANLKSVSQKEAIAWNI